MSLEKHEIVCFEEIAKHLARGRTPEQIQIDTSLDLDFINRCITHPDFERIFAGTWQESQLDLISKRKVKTKAREDAPDHYDKLKKLVDTSTELRDIEKANMYVTLIKMSGVVDKEEVEERVSLSKGQLDTIGEALREVG
jgi:hypothetical protein